MLRPAKYDVGLVGTMVGGYFTLQAFPTPPYWQCKRVSLYVPSTPAYASLKNEVKDVVETSVDAPFG